MEKPGIWRFFAESDPLIAELLDYQIHPVSYADHHPVRGTPLNLTTSPLNLTSILRLRRAAEHFGRLQPGARR